MTQTVSDDRAASARVLVSVSTVYLLFVFYGSWVPLHFTPLPLGQALRLFTTLPFLDQAIGSATDWATNFLLLIPLSFLWAQRLVPNTKVSSRFGKRLLVIMLGIAVACALEFSQLYFPPRTVSQKDILALSLGALVGVAAQYRWGSSVENLLERIWQHESRQVRLVRLLHVYLLVLFAFSVMPLDLTVSVVELYHKWREGRVVLIPFGGLKGGVFQQLYETATDILVWIPVGVLWALGRRSSLLKVAVAGWMAATVIEAAQLFVYSRVTDATDILLAGAGAAIGATLANKRRNTLALLAGAGAGLWLVLWIVWAVAMLCVFWSPFNFQAEGVSLGAAWHAMTRLPLLMLYQGSEYHAVNELLRKIAFFLPGGILWGLRVAANRAEHRTDWPKWNGISALAVVPLTIEVGQLFIPGRYADLTDVLLATGGSLLGMALIRWVLGGSTVDPAPSEAPHEGLCPPVSVREMPLRSGTEVSSPRIRHLTTFFGLLVTVAVVTRLPSVPYNVRELNAPGIAGALSTLGLSLAIYWISTGHFLFLRWAGQSRMLLLPVWLIVHGIVAWILLRSTLPAESIHDILGAPVLNWAWEWELIGRYLALHAAIALQAVGAIVFLRVVYRRGSVASLFTWMMFSVLLAWPLHLIVVEFAATDNLTELMRGGGSFAGSALLASGLFAFFLSGGSIAALLAFSGDRGKALVLAAGASLIAGVAFWYGSEHLVMKYGKIFSAWQFLLSTSRQSYAEASGLFLRYLAAYFAMAGALGVLQLSHLGAFGSSVARRSRSASPT